MTLVDKLTHRDSAGRSLFSTLEVFDDLLDDVSSLFVPLDNQAVVGSFVLGWEVAGVERKQDE